VTAGWQPGARLPSSRVLAADIGVARGTVAEAYDQLVVEGWLAARQGSGTAVAWRPPQPGRSGTEDRDGAQELPPRFDFTPGSPDVSAFPRQDWAAAVRRSLRDLSDADLRYGDPRGLAAVRTVIADYVARTRAVRADPARIVIAGDSAGGNIAAAAARLLRDEARRPCLQWLIHPVTDLGMDMPSYASCGKGFLLTRAGMQWSRGHYLNDPSEADDPRASPLRANDLAGLPPALIYTAGFDPLRDEGQAYADRLSAAGVKTIHHEFESLIHGFVGMRGVLQAAARAMDDMVAGVRHELAQLGR
jgi:hypothetical protein